MVVSDTVSLDKKLESLPLAVLQQIVVQHSIVLSEADLCDTVCHYLLNIKNEEEGAVMICHSFKVGTDGPYVNHLIEGPLGRATPPPFNFCFGTQLQIGERKRPMQDRRQQEDGIMLKCIRRIMQLLLSLRICAM